MEAHKQEVNDQGNSKANDNNVTHVAGDNKSRKAHKKMLEDKSNKPKRKPNVEERKMIGKAMEILIISCMKNQRL